MTFHLNAIALCEVALSDGSDLLAEEMKFGLGWNLTQLRNQSFDNCLEEEPRVGTPIRQYLVELCRQSNKLNELI